MPAGRLYAEADALALGRRKRLIRESSQRDLAAQLDAEAEHFRASTQTVDFAEGVEAFLGKRGAVFVGR